MQSLWLACMSDHGKRLTARSFRMSISINFAPKIEHKPTISPVLILGSRERLWRPKEGRSMGLPQQLQREIRIYRIMESYMRFMWTPNSGVWELALP
jgi:hypothetical protein